MVGGHGDALIPKNTISTKFLGIDLPSEPLK